ncbi:hypothetical protein K3495_g8191 [Podosphaera aphanis]|nr:hypothetical protein K3495_g8191 [Podosphaera aphanis]
MTIFEYEGRRVSSKTEPSTMFPMFRLFLNTRKAQPVTPPNDMRSSPKSNVGRSKAAPIRNITLG